MDYLEAMTARHSVRSYENRPLPPEIVGELERQIEEINAQSGLHIQLVTNEPKAFDSAMAHYGKFSGVTNYFALVGKKGPALEESCGYYGEKLVLAAQAMGLNTCWVALTFKKVPGAYTVEKGEKLLLVIALGYGKTQGAAHRSKAPEELADLKNDAPAWFSDGVKAAALAPTAVNQQKFRFFYDNGKVAAEAGRGFYTKTDLGIAKLHFELGAGKGKDIWK
ncbi:MAG: nitroreductase [Clostridia bacterium]|nr:nitroreductase [Clostridia bacterium]